MSTEVTEGTDHRGRHRVAVTGMGVKTPAGNDLDTFWSTLLAANQTAAARIERWDPPDDLGVKFACEVKDFDPEPYLGTKEARRQDRVAQLGHAAAADALKQAGALDVDPARCGVVVGSGIGGLITLEDQVLLYGQKGATRVSPFLVPMMMANATTGLIAIQNGWTGPSLCITTACAAGTHAVGEGARLIRDGSSDVVIAGGSESSITPVALAAFGRMGALSGRNDDPARASRPFDVDRDGFVMGEGAGMLVLERWEHALARGATILGEVLGYGRNSDGYHITAPAPGGVGQAASMHLAIDDAGIAPSEIGHINAHGTSTPLNDASESEAVLKVFGDAPPITSTKGVTGHLIGAAGAIEAIAVVLSIHDGVVPPTANLVAKDPEITTDVVAGSPREVGAKPGLSNSFGFGGHNATLILGPAA